jgi:Putative restriction endonuclease
MGEDRPSYDLKAPGASGHTLHLPGRGPFPPLDDRLVEPEVTRDEIIGGRRVVAFPSEAPHADQHGELQYVLRAHVAPGYVAAVDLLTRHDLKSDFASDVCVRRAGVDPQTGSRYLEELAFEVVSEQKEREVSEKVPRMHHRGVRRIFALFVKNRQVCEWSLEGQGSWQPLTLASRIEDPCLAIPVAVAALLDAATADDAVIEALAAKDNPALRRREAAARNEGEAQGRTEGRVEGMATSILRVLEMRGIAVSPAQRQEILRCADLDRLDLWLGRVALASSAEEVLQE